MPNLMATTDPQEKHAELFYYIENMMLPKQVGVSMTNKECCLPTVASVICCVSYHLANIISHN